MGYYKQKMIEDDERGVDSSYTGYNVCQNCFDNPGLKQFIFENAIEQDDPEDLITCDFCEDSEGSSVVADLDAVCEYIVQCIKYRYNNPANELPYETAEGGYQGDLRTTDDLLSILEMPNDSEGRLETQLNLAINEYYWCERDYFGLNDRQRYDFSWEHFKEVAIGGSVVEFMYGRFGDRSETMSPIDFLDWLLEQAVDLGMVKRLESGTKMFRVRASESDQNFYTATDLGPPPAAYAKENRLSPTGTVMAYMASSLETALAETVRGQFTVSVGEFRLLEDIEVLDLTDLPDPVCFFDMDNAEIREVIGFLHAFSDDVSRPLEPSDDLQIGYRPTQILTQHVRKRLQIQGRAVKGIVYKSAQNENGTCYGLFATSSDFKDADVESSPWSSAWIELENAYEYAGSRDNLA